jgi:hypothetical protein
MESGVGPVIAQREGVVKRLFRKKEVEQTAFRKNEGNDGYQQLLLNTCTGQGRQHFRTTIINAQRSEFHFGGFGRLK